jgi:repressor LexA
MAKGLTRRQADILQYVIECIRELGYPPTIAEIGERFRISSTNGVNDHLRALERKGYIERSSKARSIQVTDKAATSLYGLYQQEVGTLPLVGRVAAGTPVLAQENIEGQIPVSADLAQRPAFCLRVWGDSMIEAGIFDGDIIVVDQGRRAVKGDIVVALVSEDDATVKHFHPDGDTIELRPANSAMEPIRVHAGDVRIQGVAVALQRTLN